MNTKDVTLSDQKSDTSKKIRHRSEALALPCLLDFHTQKPHVQRQIENQRTQPKAFWTASLFLSYEAAIICNQQFLKFVNTVQILKSPHLDKNTIYH